MKNEIIENMKNEDRKTLKLTAVIIITLLILSCLLPFFAKCQDIHSFTPTNWVTDMGDFYNEEQEKELNIWISNYEKKTSLEIAIVTVKSLDGEPIELYAEDVFERLKIGKKGADNGLLLVFSMADRKSRIETGSGMDEFLNTNKCKDILIDYVRPRFKEGNYYQGTVDGLNQIRNILGDSPYKQKLQWLAEQQTKAKANRANILGNFLVTILLFILIIGVFFIIKFIVKKIKDFEEKKRIRSSIDFLKYVIYQDCQIKSSILNNHYIKLKNEANNYFDNQHKFTKLKDLENTERELYHLIAIRNDCIKKLSEEITKIKNNRLIEDIENAYQTLRRLFSEIETYGYSMDRFKISITNLKEQMNNTFLILDSDFDKAKSEYDNIKNVLNTINSKIKSAESEINKIYNAKKKLEIYPEIVQNALDRLKPYNVGTSEYTKITKLRNEFDVHNKGTDILLRYHYLSDIIDYIDSIIDEIEHEKARKRIAVEEEKRRKKREKEEEEERERRRRNDSYYGGSSYNSWSSSSSSSDSSNSSWDSFGGGDTSGGGFSSDW